MEICISNETIMLTLSVRFGPNHGLELSSPEVTFLRINLTILRFALIFLYKFGFDGLFLGRIDYADKIR